MENNRIDLSQFDGHYPGPWIEEHGCIYCDGGNGEVAQVDLLANMTAEEYDATTRLLAAAPDLLAALKESRKEVEELREMKRRLRDILEDQSQPDDFARDYAIGILEGKQ